MATIFKVLANIAEAVAAVFNYKSKRVDLENSPEVVIAALRKSDNAFAEKVSILTARAQEYAQKHPGKPDRKRVV